MAHGPLPKRRSNPSRPSLAQRRSTLLATLLLLAGGAHADYVGGIRFDHPSPSFLPHSVYVTATIDYKVDAPGGARIFAIPYSEGQIAPGTATQPSGLLAQGTGTTTRFFRLTSGTAIVDQVQILMVSADQSETYLELFVPAHFQYGPHGVYDLQPDFTKHSQLPHGRQFTVEFSYAVDAPGCRIFARPFTDGALTPGYVASTGSNLPPSGTETQFFYFNSDADVTHIRFSIYALDGTTLLAEYFVSYPLHWRPWGLYNIAVTPDYGSSLHNSQFVTASFTLEHDVPDGMLVWLLLMKEGFYADGLAYQPSSTLPPGTHDLSRWARIHTGTEQPDAAEFVVRIVGSGGPDLPVLSLPRTYYYGPHAVGNVSFSPASPALLSYGERLNMSFDYLTDEAAGVRIFPRAAYQGTMLPGASSTGSVLYAAPSGSGTAWTTFNADRLADSVRFLMLDADQSETLLEWFARGDFAWGGAGTITGVEPVMPALALLGHGYPNPFNPTATIPVTLGHAMNVDLAVFDTRGRLVRQLHRGELPAGEHRFTMHGDGLSSGAYICRLTTPDGVQSQRLMLIK